MKRSILIIDDEIDQCLLMAGYLKKKDYSVEYAHTLAAGIEKLRLNTPDTLLLDNNLPDGLGWKYASLIHGLFPQIRITLMTAGDMENVNIAPGFQRLNKPMHFEQLDACLQAA